MRFGIRIQVSEKNKTSERACLGFELRQTCSSTGSARIYRLSIFLTHFYNFNLLFPIREIPH